MVKKSTGNNAGKFLLVIIGIFSLTSCANGQDHKANQKWLENVKQAEQDAVVLNNESRFLPLTAIEDLKIASLDLGFAYHAVFDSLLNKYARVDGFSASSYLAAGSLDPLVDDTKYYNTLVIQVPDAALTDQRVVNFIRETEKKKKLLIVLFGNGKGLTALETLSSPVIWSPQFTPEAASCTAQAVFGGVAVTNVLKQAFGQKFREGAGFSTAKIRLKYTVPEEVGINAANLGKIDQVAAEAIREHAAPGAVVMVVKDGKVILNKAYGSHQYDKARAEKITDIFDLASVTKISATTMEVMHLVETGQLSLDSTLSKYIARTRGTNRQDIQVKEVMLHQAGFVSFIPFYQNLKPGDFSRDSSAEFPTKAADNYFMRKNYYKEVMWPQMLNSRLETRGKYVYSDLSMYYMKEIVEGITNEPLDQYVLKNFYTPLGMQTAGFNPRNRFDRDRIVPTEDDTYFRKTLLVGYVHDQGAAMVGGVSGHAGLFASANDLAILYQMVLNKGTYGGRQYFKPETVDLFTAKQSGVSRRGYGFDRWDPEVSKHYPSEFASPQTFGHTGYTGTCVWIDPQYNLVYIFLSNRVNPQVTDKLLNLSIRPRIQDVVYEAIKKGL
ncbi:serine hydrolase domain-containing protein [Hufsiella ginkgonis]|uniref:Serine hydrolase n=1 Tax=Hufsiella ginkgonis TaxID=2695274 RepID=A0A7K1Y2L5_9SPHI|nr:serine hydrolase [Hufsiella ginkgonis]MXV16926.1 serine hydrolase [Hufsiella ginkgonis]